jgi:flagellar hook-associated protein 3 FlgL
MISRIGSDQLSRNFLFDLGRNQLAISQSQTQLATGKRINTPADDPIGTAVALGIRDDLASVKAWQANISDGTSWLSATDDALGGYQDILQNAHELAVQGGNGTLSNTERGVIADQVLALRDQVVEAGNASIAGRYLFGGTRTDRPPFSMTANAGQPGMQLPLSTGQLTREIAQGQVVAVNVTADQIATPAGAPDVFTTLTNLANDLRNGNLTAASGTDMTNLQVHMDNVSALRGVVGNKMNRLDATSSRHSTADIARQKQQADLEDTDMAQAITDLNMRQSVLQASLAVGARVMQKSLADFLG